jgi:hypothetical protein
MQYGQRDMHIFEHYWFIPVGAQVAQPITLKKFQRKLFGRI